MLSHSLRAASLCTCQRHRTVGTGGQKAQARAERVGAWRSGPPFLSPSWRQEDLANGLSAGNYVLILGLLHYHQPRLRLDGCPGELVQCKQIEMHFVLDRWQQGWSLTALWPITRTKTMSFYSNTKVSSLRHTDSRLEGMRLRDTPLSVWMGAPKSSETLAQGHTAR